MIERRCTNCNKLLFKGIFSGVIEIKCPKCKHITQFILTENEGILDAVRQIKIVEQ